MGYSPIGEIMHSLSGRLASFEELALEGVVVSIDEKGPRIHPLGAPWHPTLTPPKGRGYTRIEQLSMNDIAPGGVACSK